ncbi:type II toxin-antitoxin system tRNA(fMet)-specific endonuclease VapC [Arenicella xantha]|uniref:Ribonuclease VapC n=1 Tax=Arenicella xantha TaxID=644221 RepID=A0A395JJ29_9GAMM|nr:tRNA(fMet)-specific endonuclease VapC [Arenicella xantha]RBP48674.1 tRNA(fMet)-specific endonuclease VapC [Arenicella xantha]
MIKYLLDTDMSIYTIKRKPHEVRRMFNVHAGAMAISTVTLGELLFGAENSSNPPKNIEIVDGFASRLHVLDYDEEAAKQFAQLKAELKDQMIGAYDIMIAAHARSRGFILVTNNTKEFERVQGLRIESWVHENS